jgi:serine/threonine protein kinase
VAKPEDSLQLINASQVTRPDEPYPSRDVRNKKKKKSSPTTPGGKKDAVDSEREALLTVNPRYVCLVMEYFPEGDLSSYILNNYRRGCPEYFVLHVLCKQIVTCLKHLHGLTPPLVHRDLKCENILLADNASKCVVTDFGLAQQIDKSYMTTRAGSLHYVAPECWKKHYTAAVDMWGVGCIMYAASTGRVTAHTARIMFNDAKDPGFERDIRHDLRKYSPFFIDVVLGLLKVEPNERLTPAAVLRMIEEDRSPTSPPGSFPGSVAKPPPKEGTTAKS